MSQDIENHGMYVVEHGDHAGNYFIVIEKTATSYNCLTLPRQAQFPIPIDAFDRGKKQNIFERVADIPDDIYDYCKHIYNSLDNEESNNS